jgi:uncharacterized protein
MTMKKNPVFWLIWFLPAAAVVASFATLAIAMSGADRPLPATYHWEGEGLDKDFERARRAVELGVAATLSVGAPRGECVLELRGRAPDSAFVRLLLTHAEDAELDRQVLLRRSREGEYRAACELLPASRWRIALDDEAAGWTVRSQIDGSLDSVELRARDPDGAS